MFLLGWTANDVSSPNIPDQFIESPIPFSESLPLQSSMPEITNPGLNIPPQPSNGGNFLFGSDLSQVDKDLIFEGLKKLYKKKVHSMTLSHMTDLH